MANYIITNNRPFFEKIGKYKYASLSALENLPEKIGFDSETTALKPIDGHMFACQISDGKNNYLIDMQKLGGEITFDDVKPYLKGKQLIGHNLLFDLGWLYHLDFWPDKVWDTFLASKIIYNGKPGWFRHTFGHCMERELGLDYDKSEQKNIAKIQLSTAKAIQYCFNDVDRIIDLMVALGAKIRSGGYIPTYLLHCWNIRGLAYTEQCGMPIHPPSWKEKMRIDREERDEYAQKVHDYIYEHLPKYRDLQGDLFAGFEKKTILNLASSPQMIPVFEEFGIDVRSDKTASGKSIKEDVIQKSPHEFVRIWLDYVHAEKNVTSFGQGILDKIRGDGRAYTSFNPILDTARISTRKNELPVLVFPGKGAVGKRTRSAVRALPGFKMIVCDYDGQENVVGADLHNDPVMVASINEGLDLHCAFARVLDPDLLGDLSDDEIKEKHPDKRQDAKSPRFAFAYGGSGFTVAQAKGIPLEEGEAIEKAFKELHAGVYDWGKEVCEEAVEVGYIESADGFKLHLPDWDDWKVRMDRIKRHGSEFWEQYRAGKEIHELKKEYEERGEEYIVPEADKHNYRFYMGQRMEISWVYSKKGQYMRLSLNNPVQTTSAHQTKRAVAMLFDYIVSRGHQWRARICNIPHDEIVLEVEDELVEEYRLKLQECMVEAGQHYMKSGLVRMSATANVGDTWYEAK